MKGVISFTSFSVGFALLHFGLWLIYEPLVFLFSGGYLCLVGLGMAKEEFKGASK